MKKRQKRLKKKVNAMTHRLRCHGHSLIHPCVQAKQKKPRTGDATGGGPAAQKEGDVSDSDDSSDEEELAGRGDLD